MGRDPRSAVDTGRRGPMHQLRRSRPRSRGATANGCDPQWKRQYDPSAAMMPGSWISIHRRPVRCQRAGGLLSSINDRLRFDRSDSLRISSDSRSRSPSRRATASSRCLESGCSGNPAASALLTSGPQFSDLNPAQAREGGSGRAARIVGRRNRPTDPASGHASRSHNRPNWASIHSISSRRNSPIASTSRSACLSSSLMTETSTTCLHRARRIARLMEPFRLNTRSRILVRGSNSRGVVARSDG